MHDTYNALHDHLPQGWNASTDVYVLWIENVCKYVNISSSFGIFVILIADKHQELMVITNILGVGSLHQCD